MTPSSSLWGKFRERRGKNRDLKIIITARDSQTGTGKTTLALWLAMHFDVEGFNADKVTLHPREFLDLYKNNPVGSVIIMDEAEQLDARRSMSQKNIDFWNLWQTMRYRQITSILTLPTRSALDKRGLELCDIWIQVTARGHARVHQIGVGDYDGQTQPVLVETIEFPDVTYLPVKDAVDDKKIQLVEEGEEFIESEAKNVDPDSIRKETRDTVIRGMYELDGVTQQQIADAVGITQRQVSNIVNQES
jgi:predicted XRE-type DNA-binding protein